MFDMDNSPEISEERSLELYRQVRELAFQNMHLRMPIQQLRLADTEGRALVRKWKESGWIEPAPANSGAGALGNWALPKQYWAYMPGDERIMTPDEQALYIKAARENLRADKAILVTGFMKMAPKEGLYRLIEVGIVTIIKWESNRRFVLAEEYR
jgi:hypothetical protein